MLAKEKLIEALDAEVRDVQSGKGTLGKLNAVAKDITAKHAAKLDRAHDKVVEGLTVAVGNVEALRERVDTAKGQQQFGSAAQEANTLLDRLRDVEQQAGQHLEAVLYLQKNYQKAAKGVRNHQRCERANMQNAMVKVGFANSVARFVMNRVVSTDAPEALTIHVETDPAEFKHDRISVWTT